MLSCSGVAWSAIVPKPESYAAASCDDELTPSSPTYLSVLILALSRQVNAQLGTTVCICSPAMYMMSFNFSQTCENTGVTGAGVLTTDCAIAPFQNDNITDLTPVSVGSIDILELDADLVLFTQSSRFGSFADGATFSYTSISSDPTMVNVTQFPKALQVSVIGNNAAGETLFFAGLIIFSTECGIYPILDRGSSIGWVQFIELTDALNAVCPLAPPPNAGALPTIAPATSPVTGPLTPTVSSPPTQSTKEPRPTRSPKGKTPTRSPKEPTPFRSTKAPSPTVPTVAPVMKADSETIPPFCFESGKGKKSKGKGKKSKKDDKDEKDGKGKDKGSVRGGSDSRKKKSKDYHNIFYHDECPSTKSPAPSYGGKGKGKGKGKGGYYDYEPDEELPVPLPAPLPTPTASLAPATVRPVIVPTATTDSNDEPIRTQAPSSIVVSTPTTPAPSAGSNITNDLNVTSIAIPGTTVDSQEGVTPRSVSNSAGNNALIYGLLGLAVVVVGASAFYVRRQRLRQVPNLTEQAKLTSPFGLNNY